MKQSILSLFSKIQVVQVATCADGQPHVRPMTLISYQEKFYLATGARDAKAAEISQNPKVELCMMLPDDKHTGTLRMEGIMQQIDDLKIKKEVADWAEFIYDHWKDISDPGFRLYEVYFGKVQYIKPGEMLAENLIW